VTCKLICYFPRHVIKFLFGSCTHTFFKCTFFYRLLSSPFRFYVSVLFWSLVPSLPTNPSPFFNNSAQPRGENRQSFDFEFDLLVFTPVLKLASALHAPQTVSPSVAKSPSLPLLTNRPPSCLCVHSGAEFKGSPPSPPSAFIMKVKGINFLFSFLERPNPLYPPPPSSFSMTFVITSFFFPFPDQSRIVLLFPPFSFFHTLVVVILN